MARYVCKCGYVMSNSVNSEIEYRVYSDGEWLRIVNDKEITEPLKMPDPERTIWICPQCERLYLWKEQEEAPQIYAVDPS